MTFDDDGPHAGAGALPRVHGAGGGSGKGGGGAASSAPDTLFSTATVRLVDLLGEGEIVGVRGGLKGVYLNDVPVQNADGSFNFKGLTAEFRVGTPDQPYMAGYPDVQTPNNVGIKVNAATPVTVSISDTDVDRLRVTIQVPSLFLAKSDGSVRANSVSYRIQARYSGGPWVNALGDQTITGKTTSGYFRSHEIALPINPSGASAPWQVQVIRLSPDTDDFNNSQAKFTNQSDLVFHSTTSIVDARFGYPHSALVGLTAQAASFGSSVPGRTYLVDGVLMPIPSNYDPVARTYAGVWDGTFKEGFSNNPAWALNLVLRNDRFGLGAFIDTAAIDKWSLYEIGRYCDVQVSDGKGGQEPRYVFNGAISTQQEAFELLQLIAQVFRGTVYWSSGTVTAAQDRPADPVLLVTEANVIDGEFSYASSGRRARHTVAIVAWNDPDNLYKQTIEVVEDAEGVARYGYNPTKIDLLGCTSRGQAHRTGLWTLFTELHQTQVLAYKAGLDHAVIRPGDIVAVQDPQIANLDLSGRLMGGSTATTLKLDRPVTLTSGTGYAASVMLPDGTVQDRAITTGAGTTDTVALASALSQVPDPAAVWLITGPVAPQLFRIVSIREEEPHIYAVSALQHEPGKYAAIDDGAAFEPSVVSEFPAVVLPPTNLSVRESQYTELGQPKQAMTLSWTAGQPFNSVAYYVTVIRPSGATATTRTASQSIDFLEAEVGVWTFVVTAIGLNGRPSLPVQTTYTLAGWAGQVATTVTGLSVKGGGSTFSGRSCTVAWANQIAATVPPYPVRNAVYVFDASTQVLVHREVLPAGVTEWTYDYFLNSNEGGPRRQFRVGVTAYSAAGDEGPPAYLTVSNPPPAGITPTLTATSEVLFVSLPPVTDPDFAGYLVWVSETPGINPLTAKASEVTGSLFTFEGTPDKTYYVRAAAYDAFGKNSAELNVSAEQSQAITIKIYDPLAPSIPGQPSVSANVPEIAPDGTVTSKITIGWPAVADRNFGTYEVAAAEGSNPAESAYGRSQFVAGTTASFAGLMPGRTYSFKVRANPKNGFADSGWSAVLVVTAASNTAAPANPTNVSLTQSLERVAITFTPPADKDLDYIEVWAAGGTFAQASPVGGTPLLGRIPYGSSSFFDPLAIGGVRTYWLRSVNTSGTPAASYVRAGAVTSVALQAAQIAAGIVDETKLATSLAAPVVVQALPAAKGSQFVTLASDGKLYRWDATLARYTAAVAASDIAGKIVGTQITDGSITTPLLGANVVTAAKIDATEIFANSGVFNSLKVGIASFGGLTADQIAAGAITTDKIGVGLNLGNQIWNSDFLGYPAGTIFTGMIGYARGDASFGNGYLGTNASGKDWQPPGMGSMQFSWDGTPNNGSIADIYWSQPAADGTRIDNIPVVGGRRYELSAYVSAHRSTTTLILSYYDASNNYITAAASNVVNSFQSSGQLSTWARCAVFSIAPANAAYARITLRMGGLGQATPFNFWTGLYFGRASQGQQTFSDWAPGAWTVIHGGTVATGTLNANKITAGTIGTDRLVAGQINVDTIAVAGSISADKLNVNVLTAGNITITGGTKLSSWASGTQINGGAIAANSIEAQRLRISTRGITPVNINFGMERDANGNPNGVLYWTAGQIEYIDDNGNRSFASIPGARVGRGSDGWVTVWWNKTVPGALQAYAGNYTTAVFADPNCVLVATSADITGVTVNWGGVIIDGDKIIANSIQARNIAANAIQTTHMAANTINADRLLAGSITAAKIQASTITGDKIAANTIAASNIQANSISAKHISIGDTSNMLLNGDFGGWGAASTEGWSYIGGTIDTAGPDDPGGYHRLLGTQSECGQSVEIAGQAGDTLYISAMNWNSSSYTAYLAVLPLKANGDLIEFGILTGRPANNIGWLRMEGFYKLPAGTQKFKVRLYSDRAGSGDGSVVYWGKVQCRRATDASLVVNGSITAAKLNVGSLSAITANIGEVTAGKARSADGRFVIDFDAKYLAIWD